MYIARGGLTGRVHKTESIRIQKRAFGVPKRSGDCRCFIPFMWSSCVSILVGTMVLLGGTAMCVSGYYAGYFSRTQLGMNGTEPVYRRDERAHYHIKNLTFAGPVFMGIGCFVIVVACVVVCETRDKLLKERADAERMQSQNKPNFYDMMINQLTLRESSVKESSSAHPSPGKEPPHSSKRIMSMKSVNSSCSDFSNSCICSTVKETPRSVFTIHSPLSPGPLHKEQLPPISPRRTDYQPFCSTPCLKSLDYNNEPSAALPRLPKPRTESTATYDTKSTTQSIFDRRPLNRLEPLPIIKPLYQKSHRRAKSRSGSSSDDNACSTDDLITPIGTRDQQLGSMELDNPAYTSDEDGLLEQDHVIEMNNVEPFARSDVTVLSTTQVAVHDMTDKGPAVDIAIILHKSMPHETMPERDHETNAVPDTT